MSRNITEDISDRQEKHLFFPDSIPTSYVIYKVLSVQEILSLDC